MKEAEASKGCQLEATLGMKVNRATKIAGNQPMDGLPQVISHVLVLATPPGGPVNDCRFSAL